MEWRGKECGNNLVLISLWTPFIYIFYSLSGSGSSLIKKKFQVNKICNRRWVMEPLYWQFPASLPGSTGTSDFHTRILGGLIPH